MILDVAEQEAMLSIRIDKVTHALCVIKLSLSKASLDISNGSRSNLLDELVCVCVDDQITIVC